MRKSRIGLIYEPRPRVDRRKIKKLKLMAIQFDKLNRKLRELQRERFKENY